MATWALKNAQSPPVDMSNMEKEICSAEVRTTMVKSFPKYIGIQLPPNPGGCSILMSIEYVLQIM